MSVKSTSLHWKSLTWKTIVCTLVLAMIVVNALANILPINGVNTGRISDGYPIYFVPAGYVFSIWGLIYLALLVFTVSQTFDPSIEVLVAQIRPLFALSCLANGAWILCWHYYQLAWSVAVMISLLLALIVIYQRLWTGAGTKPSKRVRWMVLAPFGLYLAWICVATIANVSDFLFTLGWKGAPLSGPLWAAIMMLVAAGIIASLAIKFGDAIPPLVLGWALVGIIRKFPDQTLMVWVGISATVAMLGIAFAISRLPRA